jgi:lysozyme
MNAEAFIRDLVRDENNVLYCYDDATGAPVVPGYKLKGHPSIGIGRALDVNGISASESIYLCKNDIQTVVSGLAPRLPYWSRLDDPRQRVIANIAFNAGVDGALQFKNMLSAIAGGNFHLAAAELKDSKLYQQAPARCDRLAALLLTPPIQTV